MTAGGKFSKAILIPVLLAAFVYLLTTTSRGVIDYDEGYYAQAARNMAEKGDWVTPYVNGVRFLEKPPFLYWLTAASFKIFGFNEFALRFPTAVAVTLLTWIVALTARRLSGDRAALIAGLSTAFSTGAFLFTRETLHDVWLVLFIALAMYAFVEWHLDPRHSRRSALLFYAALAAAALCKSLIGIAFPVGIVVVFYILLRRKPDFSRLHLIPGAVLLLSLTVPWHWLAAVRNEGFLDFFFVGEQFLRFFGRREPPVLWELPIGAFWALILVWLFPWTVFLPAAVSRFRKPRDENDRILANLSIAWAAVIIGFFTFSGRLEHYAFPALPAFSLLIAGALNGGESKGVLWAFRGLAAIGIITLLVGIGAGAWFVAGQGMPALPDGPVNRLDETDFSILAELPSAVVSQLLKPAILTGLALAVGFVAALLFEKRRRRLHAVFCLTGAMIAVCGAIHWSLVLCEDLISSKKFALALAAEARPGDRIIVMDDYESANSLNFYKQLPVQICGGQAYALVPGMKYPDAPKILLNDREFRNAWTSAARVFALVPKARLGELAPSGIEVKSLLHRVLVRNR